MRRSNMAVAAIFLLRLPIPLEFTGLDATQQETIFHLVNVPF